MDRFIPLNGARFERARAAFRAPVKYVDIHSDQIMLRRAGDGAKQKKDAMILFLKKEINRIVQYNLPYIEQNLALAETGNHGAICFGRPASSNIRI